MKLIIPFLLLSVFCFSCKEKPANPVEQYGTTMMQSYEKGKQAADIAILQVVRNAIRTHYAALGCDPLSRAKD